MYFKQFQDDLVEKKKTEKNCCGGGGLLKNYPGYNVKEIPIQNSEGNSMARCWKMHKYDSTVGLCTYMRKSIKTTLEVPGTTVITFETHTYHREHHSQADL